MKKNQPIRNFIDKIKPNFTEGGKFPWLEKTFEGFETFAYTPKEVTRKGSHIRDAVDMKRTMITVVIALIPALLFGMWNVGYQYSITTGEAMSYLSMWWFGFIRMLPMIAVSYIVGLGIEFMFAQIRGHAVYEGYLVSGLIIPMIVPISTPLWQLALACAFAVVFGKEVFGGTGMNFLNPALVARAFLFFAYPSHMSGDQVWVSAKHFGDALSGATPLGQLATGEQLPSLASMIIGTVPGSIGETSVIAILIGAAILLIAGIASWRVMLSVFLGGGLMGLIFNACAGDNMAMQIPFYFHFVMGGFAFGAVFMATDPVTSAQTNCGKWIYGLLIGAFTVLIRVVNPTYPEGMMLAILLMNCFAPLIDHMVVSRNIKYRKNRAAAIK